MRKAAATERKNVRTSGKPATGVAADRIVRLSA